MNQFVNNWTYGEASPKLSGRFDLPIYNQSCEFLANYLPLKQGGITRRPPLRHVTGISNEARLIPFTLSNGTSFIIELSALKMSVWGYFDDTFQKGVFMVDALPQEYVDTNYDQTDIWELQHAQYYDRMYFVHPDVPPQVLYFDGQNFSFEEMPLEPDTDESFGLLPNDYPSVVSVCQDRLWMAATNNQPFTVWASRPNSSVKDGGMSAGHYNFKTQTLATTTVEVMLPPDQWPTRKDADGNDILDEWGDKVIDYSDPTKFLTMQDDDEWVITADCAMELELASGRNDRIVWIDGLNNIIIGTEASEWMLPFNIDPTQQSASMQSSFGSERIQSVILNNGIFYLQNGNRLREFTTTEQGAGSYDHSFTADHMLSGGVRQMLSMRYPEPMVLMLKNDGTIVLFVYDRMYQIQSWARWMTEGRIISMSTMDVVGGGQELYLSVERNGNYYLEKFDFTEKIHMIDRYQESVDGDLDYLSRMVSNRLDFVAQDGTSIGRPKKVKEVWFRCLDTGRIKAGVDEDYMQTSREAVGSEDYRVNISGGTRRELRMIVESVGSDPMTLLAMSYEVEVN